MELQSFVDNRIWGYWSQSVVWHCLSHSPRSLQLGVPRGKCSWIVFTRESSAVWRWCDVREHWTGTEWSMHTWLRWWDRHIAEQAVLLMNCLVDATNFLFGSCGWCAPAFCYWAVLCVWLGWAVQGSLWAMCLHAVFLCMCFHIRGIVASLGLDKHFWFVTENKSQRSVGNERLKQHQEQPGLLMAADRKLSRLRHCC